MPSLSGVYTSFSDQALGVDEGGSLVLVSRDSPKNTQSKLRANADFWLCRDDGVSAVSLFLLFFFLLYTRLINNPGLAYWKVW